MSRPYEAKHAALAAYPDKPEKAVDLFLGYLDASREDFEYEAKQTVEQYLGLAGETE